RHKSASPRFPRASSRVRTSLSRPEYPSRRNRPWRSWEPDSFDIQNIMCGPQGRKDVAANINEGFDAGLAPIGLVMTGAAGKVDDRARGRQCLRGGRRLRLIDFVG